MATLATEDTIGNILRFSGGVGVNTTDVVVQTSDVSRYNTFEVFSAAGVVAVFVTLDDVNYAQVALEDLGAASATGAVFVTTTVAGKLYRFKGLARKVQVQQSGAVAATGVVLVCGRLESLGF